MNYVTGNTIKRLREKKGITQKQLADMMENMDLYRSMFEKRCRYLLQNC